jgi:hypothetical protein
MYRGSRKHVLDWTDQPEFHADLVALMPSIPIEISLGAMWMPRGHNKPVEARLESFGPSWMPASPVWGVLDDWWVRHKRGANTPNWDIAVGCTIEHRPGLVLVESKANWPELSTGGKILVDGASSNSSENHDHIGRAIDEACVVSIIVEKASLVIAESGPPVSGQSFGSCR